MSYRSAFQTERNVGRQGNLPVSKDPKGVRQRLPSRFERETVVVSGRQNAVAVQNLWRDSRV